MSIGLRTETTAVTQKQDNRFSAGDWWYWKGEYEMARKHFQHILQQPLVSTADLVRCYKSMGAVEVESKNYDEALNIYNKQLDILMKCDWPTRDEDIMACYVSMGKVYWLKSDYAQAIKYHQQALDAPSLTSNPNLISTIHKNLANIYTNAKEFDLAAEHFHTALGIDRQYLRADHPKFGQTYANMGKMFQAQGNYKEALIFFNKARETWLKSLASTHVYIEKIEETIRTVETELASTSAAASASAVIQSYIQPSLDIQPVDPFDILTRSNIMVIWLDEHIGRDENCRALKMEFRQITNSLKMVDSVDSCRQCLPYVKNRKLFFIIQGKHAKEIVPDIVEILSPSMKPIVYIFCLHMNYLTEWAQEQECIMEGGIFDHEKDLLSRLTKDLNDYVKQKSIEYKNYLQPELISTFLANFKQICERCYQARDEVASSHETGNDKNQVAAIIT